MAYKHTKGIKDVLAERIRQIEAEGFDDEHDKDYCDDTLYSLAQAASCYSSNLGQSHRKHAPYRWPFFKKWWKPTTPRRDLVKAAALIIAQIDLIDKQGK